MMFGTKLVRNTGSKMEILKTTPFEIRVRYAYIGKNKSQNSYLLKFRHNVALHLFLVNLFPEPFLKCCAVINCANCIARESRRLNVVFDFHHVFE